MYALPHIGAWLGAHWQLLLLAVLSLTAIVSNIYKIRADRITIEKRKQEKEQAAKLPAVAPKTKTRHKVSRVNFGDLSARIRSLEEWRQEERGDSIELFFGDVYFVIGTSLDEPPDDDRPPDPSAPKRVRLATPIETAELPAVYNSMNLARYQKIIRSFDPQRIFSWIRAFVRRFIWQQPTFVPA